MNREDKMKLIYAKLEKSIRESRKSFWTYCKTINPKFYKDDRVYLKTICDTLQSLYEQTLINPTTNKPYRCLQLNCPPGFGKSYTMILFAQWLFGNNIDNEVITVSYNEKLSEVFGKTVRNGIEALKDKTKGEVSFKDVFPNVKIKYGDAAKSSWALEGRHHSYLATSFTGTLTGMRGNCGIIDDPVKSAEVAYNEQELENQWEWYKDTFLSRMVEGAIQIIVQTRWSTKDLSGRLLELEPDKWYVLKFEAYDEDTDTMLCDELMSKETYIDKKSKTSADIFLANYHQLTVDTKGKLYSKLRDYQTLPTTTETIAYCDTADTGNDYLSLVIASIYKGQAYIKDIYYTKESMEITEPIVTKLLYEHKVNTCYIESNNGGRGFARNIERLLWDTHHSRHTRIEWFHQSQNKQARILSNATNVMNNIYFPINWQQQYKDAYIALNTYQKEGKNKHDDFPDTLTGLYEKMGNNTGGVYSKKSLGIR